MRMDTVVQAARSCYPEEFTVNDLADRISRGPGRVCEYNTKVEIRQKLASLSKFGIVERRNEGRFVVYRYIKESEAD